MCVYTHTKNKKTRKYKHMCVCICMYVNISLLLISLLYVNMKAQDILNYLFVVSVSQQNFS